MNRVKFDTIYRFRAAVAVALLSGLPLTIASAGPADDAAEAQARESWRGNIVRTAVPEKGCFYASYPSTAWTKVACTVAPDRPYVPRKSSVAQTSVAQTVGNGNDYAAQVSGTISEAVGTFPSVTGVTSENGINGANSYSIQLNSNFMSSSCGFLQIQFCQRWQQFVYSSGAGAAFMQYWQIKAGFFDLVCPSGWGSDGEGDCYTNSAAVTVPSQVITQLPNLKLSGAAVSGGNDTLVFTTEAEAYSTSGEDSVNNLATGGWDEAEFNIVGDGNGSAATFNTGTSITVNIAVTDGSNAAPTCLANAGTTGETNNLTLGSCTATGGSPPYIQFTESN
jgi:hypothetical protein